MVICAQEMFVDTECQRNRKKESNDARLELGIETFPPKKALALRDAGCVGDTAMQADTKSAGTASGPACTSRISPFVSHDIMGG